MTLCEAIQGFRAIEYPWGDVLSRAHPDEVVPSEQGDYCRAGGDPVDKDNVEMPG